MNKPASRIAIISGELSGDSYAVDLVEQLKSVMPNASFEGISGQRTQAAGLKQWSNCQPKAVMALTQVISNIVHFRRLLDTIKQNLTKCSPDLLILIDYGGLNLRVARIASECRIPVLYYIPPKVWAWGQWRLKKIKRYVKWVAPIYPLRVIFSSDTLLNPFSSNTRLSKKSDVSIRPLSIAEPSTASHCCRAAVSKRYAMCYQSC